ncbi:MAG TPA: FAD:protein FMN transferase [Candidatus Krumholzibacteria bacterium]|nr:FAD:protein FMN transferase [Candidatus Krumholzibacteria bacterium]
MDENVLKNLDRHVDRRAFLRACGVLGLGAVAGGALQSAYHVVRLGPNRLQVERNLLRMGSFVTITAVHDSREQAEVAIDHAVAEMDRLIRILSRHDDASPLAVLNRTGELSNVPVELALVLGTSLEINRLSRGAFDVTVQPVLDLFENRGADARLPGNDAVHGALARVGSQHIRIDGMTVHLDQPGARVTLDGIAPGYIVDRMSEVLVEQGVDSHLINVSGDIRVHGRRSDGRPWHVAVEDPEKKGHYPDTIEMCSGAVSTSGNYEIYFDREKLHCHIIDPATGQSPVLDTSVSVIAGTSMWADALSTAVFVMPPQGGCNWIDALPGTECLVIGRDGGRHRSQGWSRFDAKA